MNVLPSELRNFEGDLSTFKALLDSYLSLIPDQPETETLKPEVCDCDGKFSNSVYDWIVKRGQNFNWIPGVDLVMKGFCYNVSKSNLGKGSANAHILL